MLARPNLIALTLDAGLRLNLAAESFLLASTLGASPSPYSSQGRESTPGTAAPAGGMRWASRNARQAEGLVVSSASSSRYSDRAQRLARHWHAVRLPSWGTITLVTWNFYLCSLQFFLIFVHHCIVLSRVMIPAWLLSGSSVCLQGGDQVIHW